MSQSNIANSCNAASSVSPKWENLNKLENNSVTAANKMSDAYFVSLLNYSSDSDESNVGKETINLNVSLSVNDQIGNLSQSAGQDHCETNTTYAKEILSSVSSEFEHSFTGSVSNLDVSLNKYDNKMGSDSLATLHCAEKLTANGNEIFSADRSVLEHYSDGDEMKINSMSHEDVLEVSAPLEKSTGLNDTNNNESKTDVVGQEHVMNEKLYEIEVGPLSPDEICVEHKTGYRDSDSWTEDESDSSSSSDSEIAFNDVERRSPSKVPVIKTKGEVGIEDLPPIQYLKISVDEKELRKIGKIHGVVLKLVVIKACKDQKALDMDSVLFLAPNRPLGRVFETFGPVVEPFYTVLFNKAEDIIEKGINIGDDVYFAPDKTEMTSYVFVDTLRKQKGSDASWMDNNEPPEEHLDYSDDEQERAAKKKRRGKNRFCDTEDDEVQIVKVSSSTGSLCDSNGQVSCNDQARNTFPGLRHSNFSYSSENSSYQNPSVSGKSLFKNSFTERESPRSSSSLKNVPVWISTPPPYLEPKPLPALTSNINISQPFSVPQSIPQQIRPQPLINQQTLRQGPILLNPKQIFIPRQPPNPNQQPLATPSGNMQYNPQPMPQAPSSGNMNYVSQPVSQDSSSGNMKYPQPVPQTHTSGNMNYNPHPVTQAHSSGNMNYNTQSVPHAHSSGSMSYNQQPVSQTHSSVNSNYNLQPMSQAPPSGNMSYDQQQVPQTHSSVNTTYNLQPVSQAPPSGNINYNTQQMPNNSNALIYQHNNQQQHVFGQITPVELMSPAPPMSPMMFRPPPSPALYVPPNQVVSLNMFTPLPSPVSLPSPNPFWPSRDLQTPPFPNLQSPPPNIPLNIQIPTFSSPPVARFSAPSNFSIPPPVAPISNFSAPTYQQPTSKF